MSFGGWAIDEKLYNYIRFLLPEGSSILELGSGEGSSELAKHYNMTCVEHDPAWVNKFSNINYIQVGIKEYKRTAWLPTENEWYNAAELAPKLKDIDYDLLLIDGPPGSIGRGGILKYRDLFNLNVPIIIDDTHRGNEWRVAVILSRLLKLPIYTPEPANRKLFSIVANKEIICSLVNGKL
jgi:hypothetical protein